MSCGLWLVKVQVCVLPYCTIHLAYLFISKCTEFKCNTDLCYMICPAMANDVFITEIIHVLQYLHILDNQEGHGCV